MSVTIFLSLEHKYIGTHDDSKLDEELKEIALKDDNEIILFHKPSETIDCYAPKGGIYKTLEEAKELEQDLMGQLYSAPFFKPALAVEANRFKAAIMQMTIDDNYSVSVNKLFTKSNGQDWVEFPISNFDLTSNGQEIIQELSNTIIQDEEFQRSINC